MGEGVFLQGLNPEQRAAVEHFEGPLLVLAGAGSGKTRVLTTRIVRLVEECGVDPASILAVTFTNKAAGEMRARVASLLGQEPAGSWIGTFHAIGARLLRRHAPQLGWSSSFSIYDADETVRQLKRTMTELGLCRRTWPPKAVAAGISAAKNRLASPESVAREASDPFSRVVARVFPAYQAALQSGNAFDFDDLLVKPVELLCAVPELRQVYANRFRFLLVDEYQDTNHAQYRFLELLARDHGNIMVVGDDDQAIYGWRGADIRNILDFEKDFRPARIIRLEQNYRSTQRILSAANRTISENLRRKGKTLFTHGEQGEPLTCVQALDERDEAEWIAEAIEVRSRSDSGFACRDFAVLYRTNAQSRALEEAFRRSDLPYQLVGGTRFYERREIMDVLAYLKVISNPQDVGAFLRVVNYPARRIGAASQARLLDWAAERGLNPVDAAMSASECPGLSSPAARAARLFAELIQHCRQIATASPVGTLLEQLLEQVAFVAALHAEGPDGLDRIANVEELLAGAHEFDSRIDSYRVEEDSRGVTPLDLFLQKVSLLTDVDRHDPHADTVTLMTLHNAKGLEFPCVLICGLEDGLFPLARTFDEPDGIEEERRLFYVGLTRAMRKVFLTHAQTRRRAGEVIACRPSRFLDALPGELVDVTTTRALGRHEAGTASLDAWSRNAWSRDWRETADRHTYDAPVVDYAASHDPLSLASGERIRHPHFGVGTIVGLSGFGRDLRADIDFEDAGRKRVFVRLANLQRA